MYTIDGDRVGLIQNLVIVYSHSLGQSHYQANLPNIEANLILSAVAAHTTHLIWPYMVV